MAEPIRLERDGNVASMILSNLLGSAAWIGPPSGVESFLGS